MMYVETSVLDDEQMPHAQTSLSRSRRYVSPLLCATALVAVVFGGKLYRDRGVISSQLAESVGLDLVDSEVEVQMQIIGIRYDSLGGNGADWEGGAVPAKAKCEFDPALQLAGGASIYDGANPPMVKAAEQKNAFQFAVRTAVSKKAQVQVGSVTVSKVPTSLAAGTPRTSLTLTIKVPAALTATAIMSRLNDGSTLLSDIKDLLTSCKIKHTQAISVSSVSKSKQAEATVTETQSNPVINMELDIKGVYYNRLVVNEDLKKGFVAAVREGVVAGVSLNSQSVILDISNGGKDAENVPFVHVTAGIPVPSGLTADATMSTWPGGRAGIGKAVTDKLKAMSNIAQVSTEEGTKTVHDILVFPGSLHLGGIRPSYKREVKFNIENGNVKHDGTARANGASNPETDDIKEKVEQLLKTQVDKEDDVEVVYVDAAGAVTAPGNGDDLIMRVTISQDASAATLADAAQWETKLLPAVRSAQKFFKANADERAAGPHTWKLSLPELSNSIGTMDFDLVIHGINYNSLAAGTRGAFRDELATQVREGLAQARPGHIRTNKADIVVAVSSQESGSLNVKVSIPAAATDADTLAFVKTLEDDISSGTMKTELEAKLRTMPGMTYASTWTPSAISVSLPGSINDFSGDTRGTGDEV